MLGGGRPGQQAGRDDRQRQGPHGRILPATPTAPHAASCRTSAPAGLPSPFQPCSRAAMKLAAAALAALMLALPAMAEKLPPQRVFDSPDLSGPRARGVKLSPDGKAVTYIKTRADDLLVSD